MSLLSAAASVGFRVVSLRWRMNLPVPSNKRAGSGSACAVKEPVYVRSEYVDVAELISKHAPTRHQKLPDFSPHFRIHLKPLIRNGSQFTCTLFHPSSMAGSRSTAPF